MRLLKYRIGQAQAHETIIKRIKEGHPYTSIILPTRYGKTDVIFNTSLQLYEDKLVSSALLLAPGKILRDQPFRKKTMEERNKRYLILAKGLRIGTMKTAKDLLKPTVNGEFIVASTMQLANENCGVLEDWVLYLKRNSGLPPVIQIDEAHTGSEDNSWGQTVAKLVNAGAFAVLHTATAIRSDGVKIPGFEFETIEEEEATVYKTSLGSADDLIKVKKYSGTRRHIRLVANHETTFAQAWSEKPSPLCKISRVTFDVDLTEIKGLDSMDALRLSELSASKSRQCLGAILKSRQVIGTSAELLVSNLNIFRKKMSDASAIVFCCNDEDPDKEANEHAGNIKRAIEALDPSLMVVIATSNDVNNEGKDKVERFRDGTGDILIVKQMASLGLDAPRLKIKLDLSPTRTVAAYIQRIMRIATPYKDNNVNIKTCVDIAPLDCIYTDMFEQLISGQGGESTTTDLQLIDTYEKQREDRERSLFSVDKVYGGDFTDTDGNAAEASNMPGVMELYAAFNDLIGEVSHAEIVARCKSVGIEITVPNGGFRKTEEEVAAIKKDMGDAVSDIIGIKMASLQGRHDRAQLMSSLHSATYQAIYSAAGLPEGFSIQNNNDIEILRRVKRAAQGLLAKISKSQT